MSPDISSLVLYVACNVIVPVHMTRCALQPVREKEIGTTISSINQNTTRNVLSLYCVCVLCFLHSFVGAVTKLCFKAIVRFL